MQLTYKQQAYIRHRWHAAVELIPPEDKALVAGALRAAAEVYQKDSESTRGTPISGQFENQAATCLVIAEVIEP